MVLKGRASATLKFEIVDGAARGGSATVQLASVARGAC
jgi:hypothetical protein